MISDFSFILEVFSYFYVLWRIVLGALVIALLFSSYMAVYTAGLTSSDFSLFIIFPRHGYPPRGNADLLLMVIGDKTSSFRGVVTDENCRMFIYWTEMQGEAAVIYCSNDGVADVTIYVNEDGLPFGKAGINGMDVAQEIILAMAYGERKANTAFVIDYDAGRKIDNLTLIRVKQSIDGIDILDSGFELVVDESSGKIHKLIAYRIYGLDKLTEVPKPSYDMLFDILGYLNIDSHAEEINVRGLMICGSDTAYYVAVGRVAAALIKANSWDVLGLYVFDEKGGKEVITPSSCGNVWLGFPENWYKPVPA